jgi:hypothetical protein
VIFAEHEFENVDVISQLLRRLQLTRRPTGSIGDHRVGLLPIRHGCIDRQERVSPRGNRLRTEERIMGRVTGRSGRG